MRTHRVPAYHRPAAGGRIAHTASGRAGLEGSARPRRYLSRSVVLERRTCHQEAAAVRWVCARSAQRSGGATDLRNPP